MFRVAVSREFVAQYFLIDGEHGLDNGRHSHHYWVEICLEGPELDRHGYLVDIVQIEKVLDDLVAEFRDKTLNDLLEFRRRNPSLERFAYLFARAFSERISAPNISRVSAKLWENQTAWASYRMDRL